MWRWGIHHLHSHGFKEQKFWKCPRICMVSSSNFTKKMIFLFSFYLSISRKIFKFGFSGPQILQSMPLEKMLLPSNFSKISKKRKHSSLILEPRLFLADISQESNHHLVLHFTIGNLKNLFEGLRLLPNVFTGLKVATWYA